MAGITYAKVILFFIGLDGESENWYTGMRSKIERIIYLQCIDNGEKMAEQAPPISRADMKPILAAYFKCGTSDSIMRMAALITNWNAAGRGSEVQSTSFNLYKWDRINNVSGYYWTLCL